MLEDLLPYGAAFLLLGAVVLAAFLANREPPTRLEVCAFRCRTCGRAAVGRRVESQPGQPLILFTAPRAWLMKLEPPHWVACSSECATTLEVRSKC